MSAANKTIARRIFEEVFNGGDVARMDEFASPDVVVNYAGTEPIRGLAAYRELYAQDLPSFPDARYTIEDLFGAGDRVAIRWRMEATHQGTYQGIAPTGRPVTLTGVSIYRFADGKVAEGWIASDTAGFLAQLGAGAA